jgi:hypothetical protein
VNPELLSMPAGSAGERPLPWERHVRRGLFDHDKEENEQ